MKKHIIAITIFSTITATINTFATEHTQAQRECYQIAARIDAKYTRAELELMQELSRQGRHDEDYSEYLRITGPSMKLVNLIYDICADPNIASDQVELLKKSL